MSVFRPLGPLLVLAMLASPAMAGKPDKPDKPDNSSKHGWQDKHDKWQGKHDKWQDKHDKWQGKHDKWQDKHNGWCKPDHGPPPTIGAPEIDPGSVSGGLTLLLGGTLILADRRRRVRAQLGTS